MAVARVAPGADQRRNVLTLSLRTTMSFGCTCLKIFFKLGLRSLATAGSGRATAPNRPARWRSATPGRRTNCSAPRASPTLKMPANRLYRPLRDSRGGANPIAPAQLSIGKHLASARLPERKISTTRQAPYWCDLRAFCCNHPASSRKARADAALHGFTAPLGGGRSCFSGRPDTMR